MLAAWYLQRNATFLCDSIIQQNAHLYMCVILSAYMFRSLVWPPSRCSTVKMPGVQQKSYKMYNIILQNSVQHKINALFFLNCRTNITSITLCLSALYNYFLTSYQSLGGSKQHSVPSSLRKHEALRNTSYCSAFLRWQDCLPPTSHKDGRSYPFSAVSDCLFNILAAILHIWRPTPPSATWGRVIPRWPI